eukprot:16434931-Heterocapsa_arctica.AAC.1
MIRGPAGEWGRNAHPGGIPYGSAISEVPADTDKMLSKLEAVSFPSELDAAAPALKAYLRSRVAWDSNITAWDALGDAATYGVGDVAEEAAAWLDMQAVPAGRAGEASACAEREVTLTDTRWPADGAEPGEAQMWIASAGRAAPQCWGVYDYREEILLSAATMPYLGHEDPIPERRQCLLKS